MTIYSSVHWNTFKLATIQSRQVNSTAYLGMLVLMVSAKVHYRNISSRSFFG